MIAPQALVVSGCSDGSSSPTLLQVVDVIASSLFLFTFGVGIHPRGAENELGGEDRLGVVHEEEWSLPDGATWRGPVGP